MENKETNKAIMKALHREVKKGYGLSISDIQRELNIPRCQIRICLAFLLGAEKIEEQVYGKSKVYYEVKK